MGARVTTTSRPGPGQWVTTESSVSLPDTAPHLSAGPPGHPLDRGWMSRRALGRGLGFTSYLTPCLNHRPTDWSDFAEWDLKQSLTDGCSLGGWVHGSINQWPSTATNGHSLRVALLGEGPLQCFPIVELH